MKSKSKIQFLIVAFLAVAFLMGVSQDVDAYPGKGGRAERVTIDQGDTMTPFVLTIGTITAVQVYQKQAGRVDRKLVVCNGQAFNLFVGTHSALIATGNAAMVADNSCETFLTPALSLWAIYESAAGAADQVNGYKQLDSRD